MFLQVCMFKHLHTCIYDCIVINMILMTWHFFPINCMYVLRQNFKNKSLNGLRGCCGWETTARKSFRLLNITELWDYYLSHKNL